LSGETLTTAALLIGYKRIDFIQNRLSELSRNLSIPIFVSIDGSDLSTETEFKHFIEVFITNNPQTQIQYKIHKQNLGLTAHVTAAISNVLDIYDQVIVIEDDIVLSDSFIENMLMGLELLQKNPQFGIVCGFSAFRRRTNSKQRGKWRASCYFSPWGWATNAKQWEGYRVVLPADFRKELENSHAWTSLSDFRKSLWTARFAKVQSEHSPTWDYQVQFYLFQNDIKVLHSTKRFSDNEGFNRIDSTNTQSRRPKWMGKVVVSDSVSEYRFAYGSRFYEAVDAVTIGGDDRIFATIRKLLKREIKTPR
jgi:hypothetical protein